MKVLVACEESQAVTKEFRVLGHEAYSCDVVECSGGKPEWHIQQDVIQVLQDDWDMIIAFPPCTHLAVSGARWFDKKREDARQRGAIEFFMKIYNAGCDKVAVENPVNIIGGDYLKEHFPDLAEKYGNPNATQYIQPYQFGEPFEKKTGLWLRGLPKLQPTNIVSTPPRVEFDSGKSMPKWYSDAWKLPKEERSKLRSKTFQGVAKAMAAQWG